jgi:polyisoprenoid-binding protein YceI
MTDNNQTKWAIDAGHSTVQFKVKHLGIANVAGTFKVFKGEVLAESQDFDGATVQCVIDVNSLDTNNAQRDGHLKSEILFDAQKFPEIVFSGMLKKDSAMYGLAGELTIRGTVQPIVLEAEFTGTGKGRFNDTRAGFEISGKINRKEFGLTWNLLTEAGGLVIGEEIKLLFDIELIKQ